MGKSQKQLGQEVELWETSRVIQKESGCQEHSYTSDTDSRTIVLPNLTESLIFTISNELSLWFSRDQNWRTPSCRCVTDEYLLIVISRYRYPIFNGLNCWPCRLWRVGNQSRNRRFTRKSPVILSRFMCHPRIRTWVAPTRRPRQKLH